jgi:hypothetical protein
MQRPVLRGIGIVALLGLMVIGTGCTSGDDSETPSGGVTEHPIEARIPYQEQAVSVTKEHPLADLSDPPSELKTLAAFLDDPSAVDTTRLGVFVEESRQVEIASVAPNRLVLLAGHPENRLFEYNLQTGATTQIASKGSGPGQLKFAEAMVRRNASVYVARQDRRIDRFNCADAPCSYQETTRLQFSPMAAAAAEDYLAVTGEPMLGGEGMKAEDLSGAVQIIGSEGNLQQAIGRMYQATHFLVLSNYVRNTSLIYSETQSRFVIASPKLSFIWAYGEDGEQVSVWTIEDFEPLPLEYDSSKRSIHKRYEEGYSTLRLQGPLAERFVVATVRHLNLPSGASDLTGSGNDYYALDLTTGNTYYLGRDTPREEIVDRLFLVTDAHQVLIENGRVAVVTRTQAAGRTQRRGDGSRGVAEPH